VQAWELREFRARHGLRIGDIASRLGIHEMSYYRWERGIVSPWPYIVPALKWIEHEITLERAEHIAETELVAAAASSPFVALWASAWASAWAWVRGRPREAAGAAPGEVDGSETANVMAPVLDLPPKKTRAPPPPVRWEDGRLVRVKRKRKVVRGRG
jgi:DNA-binding XRE family transcriptional regulator